MQPITQTRRACITGCGVLSPIGHDVESFWQGLVAGQCALGPIRGFDTTGLSIARAAEVHDFQPQRRLSAAEIGRLERIDQFALFGARAALQDAGLDLGAVDRDRVAVIVGTSMGGMLVGEAYQRALHAGAPFAARRLFDFPYFATATNLARHLGTRGPVVSPSIACASGTQAVGMGLDCIRAGQADICIVGGVETLCAFVASGFNCLRATTADTVRPFDARRSGLLLGEGAALLVIEEESHARARGARTDIEIVGSGLAGDATHMTAPARDGSGAARAMRMALADAGLAADQIDCISAHGTGTVYNDAMEIAAISAVFGSAASGLPVSGIKGSIGHTLAAAGSFEAIMCAAILRHGVIPPTVGCEQLDPACTLDVVMGAARQQSVRTILSTSSAFAGNNAAIVLARVVV